MAAPSAQVWLRFLAQVALEAANAGVDWRVESTEFARVVALAHTVACNVVQQA